MLTIVALVGTRRTTMLLTTPLQRMIMPLAKALTLVPAVLLPMPPSRQPILLQPLE